jgi:hypothetical protein
MRIRGVLFVALAGCVSANFFACGTSSFSSESAVDGGGTDASSGPDTSTSSDGAPSGFDDGSAGGDANAEIDATARDSGTDAGPNCDAGTILGTVNQITCPADESNAIRICSDPGKGQQCCATGASTACLAQTSPCTGGAAIECESENNCGGTNTTCCATLVNADAGPELNACPASTAITGADCAGGCDPNTQVRLCSKDLACAGLTGTRCVPVLVTVGTNPNPITLGVCK